MDTLDTNLQVEGRGVSTSTGFRLLTPPKSYGSQAGIARIVIAENIARRADADLLAGAPGMLRALKVIALTPAIYAWLAEHDPSALSQVHRAIRESEPGFFPTPALDAAVRDDLASRPKGGRS